MSRKVMVAGVGMVKFEKPGSNQPYTLMSEAAVREAIEDAGIDYSLIEQAYVGYVYGDSTSGQRALYSVGMSGVPIFNVNNNCSTGSTALYLARQAVESGASDCVLALGFEQMNRGALESHWGDRPDPIDDFETVSKQLGCNMSLPFAIRYFGGAGQEHMRKYGTPLAAFAKIRAKASVHASHNPLALLRTPLSEEEILNSPELIPGALTRYMACPPTCGAAAAIVMSESFARSHGLSPSVQIAGQAMTTDRPNTFNSGSMIKLVGSDLTRSAAQEVYSKSGISAADVDVCELHDCFAPNELLCYEALGFCEEGAGAEFVDKGENTYGGAVVTNPSGGLLSKGHPLGATGLAQCYELTKQLRGEAQSKQVENAQVALQHNLGLGGACVVTLYTNS